MDVLIGSVRQVADWVANAVADATRTSPRPVLGLATGATMAPVYDELARRCSVGELSLAHVTAFLLDEYLGLPESRPQRFRRVIEDQLVARTDLRAEAVHAPDVDSRLLARAAEAYEEAISSAGGVDLQLLGIGSDGHVAFNEPGSPAGSRTHVSRLTWRTRRDNARFFEGDPTLVPTRSLTQGLGTIGDARSLVLVAFGRAKATAVAHLVSAVPDLAWPATALAAHPRLTVLADEAAASEIDAERAPVPLNGPTHVTS